MIAGPCAESFLQSRSVKVNVFKVWWSMGAHERALKVFCLVQNPSGLVLRLDMVLIIGE